KAPTESLKVAWWQQLIQLRIRLGKRPSLDAHPVVQSKFFYLFNHPLRCLLLLGIRHPGLVKEVVSNIAHHRYGLALNQGFAKKPDGGFHPRISRKQLKSLDGRVSCLGLRPPFL